MKLDTSILENWDALHDGVRSKTEEELWHLIQYELENKKRPQFILRLYGRYNIVRADRERKELLAKVAE